MYPNALLGHYTDRVPVGLGHYGSLGEYCGPHTASSVFLILGRGQYDGQGLFCGLSTASGVFLIFTTQLLLLFIQ